ncbi:MAG: flagellar biosynthetic protein FliR [Deltaproteobacteria bacterium]|nr:flagellar biosynthetic protein FliR [Deltaproteobacteria bacterium]
MNTAIVGPFLAALARASGLAFTAPLIGDPTTSTRARLVFAIAIAAAVAPLWPAISMDEVPAIAALELATGLATGLVARLVLAGVESGGQLLGLVLGLGFAQSFDPRAGESASTVRRIVGALAGLGFLGAGGLEAAVSAVAAGPAEPLALASLLHTGVERACDAMARGVGFAGPVIVAAVVGNAGIALANRAAPALNVFAVAFAALLILGGLVLIATAPSTAMTMAAAGRQAADVLRAGATP